MDTLIAVQNIAVVITQNALLWGGNFLVLIVLTIGIMFFAMKGGKNGLIALNISLYAGYALYMVFPYRDAFIGIGATPIIQACLSIILFIAACALPFIISLRLTSPSFGALSIFQDLLLSLLAAGFIMALAYHVFQISNIYAFPDPLNMLFEPKGYFFYWFVAPLLGLHFLAK